MPLHPRWPLILLVGPWRLLASCVASGCFQRFRIDSVWVRYYSMDYFNLFGWQHDCNEMRYTRLFCFLWKMFINLCKNPQSNVFGCENVLVLFSMLSTAQIFYNDWDASATLPNVHIIQHERRSVFYIQMMRSIVAWKKSCVPQCGERGCGRRLSRYSQGTFGTSAKLRNL